MTSKPLIVFGVTVTLRPLPDWVRGIAWVAVALASGATALGALLLVAMAANAVLGRWPGHP